MSGNSFDAAVLLIGDGLVAVGRVLGRFRRPCVAEKRARTHVDALNALEDSQDGLEPGQLTAAQQAAVDLGLSLADRAVTYGDQVCAAFVDAFKAPVKPVVDFSQPGEVRSAAVSRPAADNTPDHLEAAYNYHRPQANYNGTLVWGCEGCDWGGATIQAHSRHRFQILADMTAATTRVQEQLGGAS